VSTAPAARRSIRIHPVYQVISGASRDSRAKLRDVRNRRGGSADTIPYELFTRIGPRVRHVAVDPSDSEITVATVNEWSDE
jgi:hypothetical protein